MLKNLPIIPPELLKIFPCYSLKYHLAIIPKLFRLVRK